MRNKSQHQSQRRAAGGRKQHNYSSCKNDHKSENESRLFRPPCCLDLIRLVSSSADPDPLTAHTNVLLCQNKRAAASIQSPDQYVSQGAQQAERGDWSEICQQQTGQQENQRHQSTH